MAFSPSGREFILYLVQKLVKLFWMTYLAQSSTAEQLVVARLSCIMSVSVILEQLDWN